MDWVGLGHRVDGLDWIGLDLDNWTHVHSVLDTENKQIELSDKVVCTDTIAHECTVL